jgi:hypothetical protein
VAQLRYGVFAVADGWVAASEAQMEWFADRGEALRAAMRQAGVARWRGDDVEILAQDRPGGALAGVAAPPPRA